MKVIKLSNGCFFNVLLLKTEEKRWRPDARHDSTV